MSFGGHTKSHRSLLSGVYARGSKISHTGGKPQLNRHIPCRGLHTSLNHSCVSPKMGCFEYTQLRTHLQCMTLKWPCELLPDRRWIVETGGLNRHSVSNEEWMTWHWHCSHVYTPVISYSSDGVSKVLALIKYQSISVMSYTIEIGNTCRC